MKRKNIFKEKSKMIIINATIYLRHKNEEYKKVYDALKVIELMFKDKIEIKIKLKKLQSQTYLYYFTIKLFLKTAIN